MTDSTTTRVTTPAEASDMDIAYRLMLEAAYAENMDVRGAPNPSGEKATRNWIFRTFTVSYRTVKRARDE
jgi:hypothetical protein